MPETKFPIKSWFNLPIETTPATGEAFEDIEARLGAYIDVHELHWRKSVANEAARLSIKELEEGDVVLERDTNTLWRYNLTPKTWTIIGGHWLSPVEKASGLPGSSNEAGDVRLVKETDQLYIWSGSEWEIFEPAAYHWLAPVTEYSKLPTTGNKIGYVRLDEETNQFYICVKESGTRGEQWNEFVPAAKHTHTIETLTWSVAEKLTASPEFIPGGFRRLATEETQKLYEVEFALTKGKAELELQINGTAVKFTGGSTKVKVKEAAEALALETPYTFSAKDKITLVVHSVTSEPEGLAFSAFVEHTAKAV